MSEKRRGLGRGLGALIPSSLDGARSTRERPVDVFFPDARPVKGDHDVEQPTTGGADGDRSASTVPGSNGSATELSGGITVSTDLLTAAEGTTGAGQRIDSGVRSTLPAGALLTSATTIEGTPTVEHVASHSAVPTTAAATATMDSTADTGSTAGTSPIVDTEAVLDAGAETGAPSSAATELHDRVAEAVAREGLHGDLAEVPAPRSAGGESSDEVDLVPVPGAVFAELPLDEIRPNPRQPRTVFDEEALDELVGSIREIGVLQPVVVRRAGEGYELIMGERRWRAAGAAGLETIPAIIRETGDEDLLRDALLENLHRAQLNPLEEAAAYQQLLDDFGCTHDELAGRLHRSRPQISNTLRLLKLPPLVQRRVAAGVLSAGHARALLGLADGAAIERLAQRIVAEGLSVRAVEEIVALGGDGVVAKRKVAPRAGIRNEALDALAGRLSDRFETRVKVALGKSRGRLTVEFASVQDLNRILSTLAPEDPGLFHG